MDWVWVDTVCIDNQSSSELSENINSMWKYYVKASYCVAYLVDTTSPVSPDAFYGSAWFTRGWTLQELLAPRAVVFFDQHWTFIGSKADRLSDFLGYIAGASGIGLPFLPDEDPQEASIAQRMSWAAKRQTKREEDISYCLLGLFDISMPLLYGEGSSRAFERLQRDIIRRSNDESIFAHDSCDGSSRILARSPAAFLECGDICPRARVTRPPYSLTHKGLQFVGPATQILHGEWSNCYVLKLNCVRPRRYPGFAEGCILGLRYWRGWYFREAELEDEVLTLSPSEVDRKFNDGEWYRVENMQFLIALKAPKAYRRRHVAFAMINVPEKPVVPCLDDEGRTDPSHELLHAFDLEKVTSAHIVDSNAVKDLDLLQRLGSSCKYTADLATCFPPQCADAMRLINIHSSELRSFGDNPPPYVILSHRWSDELSYQDFQDPTKRRGPGFEKIRAFCELVQNLGRHDGKDRGDKTTTFAHDWAWVDTVCIDKTSSAELSEAINSMWKYYSRSAYCIAHLNDVGSQRSQEIRNSQWFKRGWTLQELLAPPSLFFYDRSWKFIRARIRGGIRDDLVAASGVDAQYLYREKALYTASIAQRMSWASKRVTTREEDVAYCLLGLFDINMPLLYGEGGERAFERLQREIIPRSNDESIFAHEPKDTDSSGLLAASPSAFVRGNDIRPLARVDRPPYDITQRALHFEGPAIEILDRAATSAYILKLNCVRLCGGGSGDDTHKGFIAQGCVLGLRCWQGLYFRDFQLEGQVAVLHSSEVQSRLNRGEWKRLVHKRFDIALPAIRAEAFADDDVAERPLRCLDADGPWFMGMERSV